MKQKGLLLGSQTGSLMNHLMSHNNTEPQIGEGATILYWTDRHAYTVRVVSEDKKTVIIQRCDSQRVDKNGMSESQQYDYSRHTNQTKTLVYKYGAWREKIERLAVWLCVPILLPVIYYKISKGTLTIPLVIGM